MDDLVCIQFIVDHKFIIAVGYIILNAVVKVSPLRWDDILLDMIAKPLIKLVKKAVNNGESRL